MKFILSLIIALTLLGMSSYGQLNWVHTQGPNGGNLNQIKSNNNYAFVSDQYHLFRTSDGEHWEALPHPNAWPMAGFGDNLAAQFGVNYSTSLSSPNEFKVSYDNGETWTTRNLPNNQYFTDIFWCSHGIYTFKANEDFAYKSTDEGLTWTIFNFPFQTNTFDFKVYENRVYFSFGSSIWRLEENGEDWTELHIPLSGGDFTRTVSVYGNKLIAGTNKNVWISDDSGSTWEKIVSPFDDENELLQQVGDIVYLCSNKGSLARSYDFGQTWEVLFEDDSYEYKFYFTNSINGKFLGNTYHLGVLTWDDSSNSLKEANNGLWSSTVFGLTSGSGYLWVGTGNGLYQFDLMQEKWSDSTLLPIPDSYFGEIEANNNGLICVRKWLHDSIYISSDFGENWDKVYPFDEPFSGNIWDVDIFDDVIFVGDNFDFSWRRSTDYGQSWENVTFPPLSYIRKIFELNGQLIAWNNIEVYVSNDLGQSWEVLANLPDGLSITHSIGGRLFGTKYFSNPDYHFEQLFTSTNGVDWLYSHDGLPGIISLVHEPDDYHKPKILINQGKYFLYTESGELYVSLDTCQTWLPSYFLKNHAMELTDGKFFAGSFGGGVIQSDIRTNIYGELIRGTVYNDVNNNGIRESDEEVLPFAPVSVVQPGSWYPFYYSMTKPDGTYAIGITPDMQDTLRPLYPSPYLENINPPYYIVNEGGTGKDFGIYLTPGIVDLSISGQYFPRPRPGFSLSINGRYSNIGTTQQDAVVSLKLDSYLTYEDANPAPSEIIGDSLVWHHVQMPVLEHGQIKVQTKVKVDAPLGHALKSNWTVSVTNNDITPSNNSHVLCDTVVGSYDPNDKKVEPADGLTAEEIAEGKEILYTVRFQNTGTYQADIVRITDKLDTALYLPSLRLVAASHTVTSFELRPGGLLEIVFDNIFLPDSTSNEPESHGFVTFAIQRNKAFNPNLAVLNKAAIYFDFNEPIITNVVSFTVKEPTPTFSVEEKGNTSTNLLVFPNPTNKSFTVSSEGNLRGKGILSLINAAGQEVFRKEVDQLENNITVERGNLLDGVYIVKLSGRQGSLAGTVVLQK